MDKLGRKSRHKQLHTFTEWSERVKVMILLSTIDIVSNTNKHGLTKGVVVNVYIHISMESTK